MREIPDFKQIISLIVAVCFLTTNAIAMPAQDAWLGERGTGNALGVKDILSLSIPASLGTVVETYYAKQKDGRDTRSPSAVSRHDPLVVYIQDAHDSLEAQESIAAMIRQFVKEYGVRTVYEEGYEGPVPTDELFDRIKDPALKEKISYYLMDKLRVGGAEYAHINRKSGDSAEGIGNRKNKSNDELSPKPYPLNPDFDLVGADSIALHLENIRAYEQSAKKRGDVIRDIQRIHKELQKLIDRDFPKAMKEWLKFKERHQNGKLLLTDYLKRTQQLFNDEKSLLGEAYLVKREAKKKPQKSASRFTLHTSQFTNIEAFLSNHEKKIRQINLTELLAEIRQLEENIVETGLSSERGQKTYGYFQSVLLLEKLNSIQLSAEEYSALKDSLENLKTEDVARFIARESHHSIVLFRSWEELINNSINFYELAKKRDESISNIFDEFLSSGNGKRGTGNETGNGKRETKAFPAQRSPFAANTAVLVFGGFHKEAIKKILKEKGISYVILSPSIGKPSKRHEDYYRMLMSGGQYEFEKTVRSIEYGVRRNNSEDVETPYAVRRTQDVVRESACPQRADTIKGYDLVIDRLAEVGMPFRSEVRENFILKMDRTMDGLESKEAPQEGSKAADNFSETPETIVFNGKQTVTDEEITAAQEEEVKLSGRFYWFEGHRLFGPQTPFMQRLFLDEEFPAGTFPGGPFLRPSLGMVFSELFENAAWDSKSRELDNEIFVDIKTFRTVSGGRFLRFHLGQTDLSPKGWEKLKAHQGHPIKAFWGGLYSVEKGMASNMGGAFWFFASMPGRGLPARLEYSQREDSLKTTLWVKISEGKDVPGNPIRSETRVKLDTNLRLVIPAEWASWRNKDRKEVVLVVGEEPNTFDIWAPENLEQFSQAEMAQMARNLPGRRILRKRGATQFPREVSAQGRIHVDLARFFGKQLEGFRPGAEVLLQDHGDHITVTHAAASAVQEKNFEEDITQPKWNEPIQKMLEQGYVFRPEKVKENGFVYRAIGKGLRQGLLSGQFDFLGDFRWTGEDQSERELGVYYVSHGVGEAASYVYWDEEARKEGFLTDGDDRAVLVIPGAFFNEEILSGRAAVHENEIGMYRFPFFSRAIPVAKTPFIIVSPRLYKELEDIRSGEKALNPEEIKLRDILNGEHTPRFIPWPVSSSGDVRSLWESWYDDVEKSSGVNFSDNDTVPSEIFPQAVRAEVRGRIDDETDGNGAENFKKISKRNKKVWPGPGAAKTQALRERTPEHNFLLISKADELADYIKELVRKINSTISGEPKVLLSSIVQNPQKYEQDFYKPLYKLFLARISADFDGAEDFVTYGHDILAAKGAKTLRDAMERMNNALQRFQKIKPGKNTSQASVEFYGKILFFLTGQIENYLSPVYDAIMATRPGIAIAREGISYHIREESSIRLRDKGVLYGNQKASEKYQKVRDNVLDRTSLDMDGRRNGEHAAKILEARKCWKKQAEKLGSQVMKERMANFDAFAVVLEFDSDLPLIVADTDRNVGRVLHTERLTHAFNFSSEFIDKATPEEIAVWLNIGQEWLDIYRDIVGYSSGTVVSDDIAAVVEEERARINLHFFDIEDSGLIPVEAQREKWSVEAVGPTLEQRISARMKEHVLKRYKGFLSSVIKESEEAERFFSKARELQAEDPMARKDDEQRKATLEPFSMANTIYGKLLNRYEAMGMYALAQKAFYKSVYTTAGVELYDPGGVMPTLMSIGLIFNALRLGLWSDFLNELEITWTGRPDTERGLKEEILEGKLRRGQPRKLTTSQVQQIEGFLQLNRELFSTKIKSMMKSQLLASPPALFTERETYVDRANQILATPPLSALKPEDVDPDVTETARSEARELSGTEFSIGNVQYSLAGDSERPWWVWNASGDFLRYKTWWDAMRGFLHVYQTEFDRRGDHKHVGQILGNLKRHRAEDLLSAAQMRNAKIRGKIERLKLDLERTDPSNLANDARGFRRLKWLHTEPELRDLLSYAEALNRIAGEKQQNDSGIKNALAKIEERLSGAEAFLKLLDVYQAGYFHARLQNPNLNHAAAREEAFLKALANHPSDDNLQLLFFQFVYLSQGKDAEEFQWISKVVALPARKKDPDQMLLPLDFQLIPSSIEKIAPKLLRDALIRRLNGEAAESISRAEIREEGGVPGEVHYSGEDEQRFVREWGSFFNKMKNASFSSQSEGILEAQNVHHLVFFYPLQLKTGGVQTYQRTVIQALLKSNRNLTIEFIYFNFGQASSKFEFFDKKTKNLLILRGIPTNSLGSEKLKNSEIADILGKNLVEAHRQKPIDLILLNSSTPHFELLNRALSFSKQHDIASHYYFHGGAITEGVRYLAQHASATVTDSQAYQKIFSDFGVTNIKTLYPVADMTDLMKEPAEKDREAVQTLRMQYGLQGRKIILHPSRVAPRKGPEVTVRAAAALLKEHPELTSEVAVVILGAERDPEQGERLRLRKIARKLGVEVMFVEGQSFAKLKNWYDAAYVVLYPTLGAEPFGLVSVEAQARGTPVIVSDGGGLPETLEDGKTGFVVQRGNVQDMTNKLYRLLKNGNLRKQMGEAGRRYIAKRFALDATMKDISGSFLSAIRMEKMEQKQHVGAFLLSSQTPEDTSKVLSNIYNEEVPLKEISRSKDSVVSPEQEVFQPAASTLIRDWKKAWWAKLNKSRPFWEASDESPMSLSHDAAAPINYDPLLVPSSEMGVFRRLILPSMKEKTKYAVRRQDPQTKEKSPAYTMGAQVLFDDPFNSDFFVRAIPHPKVEFDSLIVTKEWKEQRLTPEALEVQFQWARSGAVTEFHHAEYFLPHMHIHLYASETAPLMDFSGTFTSQKNNKGVSLGQLAYPVPHLALRSADEKMLKRAAMVFSEALEKSEQWFTQDVFQEPNSKNLIVMFILFKKESLPFGFSPVGFIKTSNSAQDDRLRERFERSFISGAELDFVRDQFWAEWETTMAGNLSAYRLETREPSPVREGGDGQQANTQSQRLIQNPKPAAETKNSESPIAEAYVAAKTKEDKEKVLLDALVLKLISNYDATVKGSKIRHVFQTLFAEIQLVLLTWEGMSQDEAVKIFLKNLSELQNLTNEIVDMYQQETLLQWASKMMAGFERLPKEKQVGLMNVFLAAKEILNSSGQSAVPVLAFKKELDPIADEIRSLLAAIDSEGKARSELREQEKFEIKGHSLHAETLTPRSKGRSLENEKIHFDSPAKKEKTPRGTGRKLQMLYDTIAPEIRKFYFKKLGKGIFIPSSLDLIDKSLGFVRRIMPEAKTFYEFGSGDGRISLLAASKGWFVEGVELDPGLVAISQRMEKKAIAAGLIEEGRVSFSQGDAMGKDFSDYDILFVTDSDGFDHQAFQDKVNREAKKNTLIVMNHPKRPLKELRLLKPWFWAKPDWLGEAEGQVAIYQPRRSKSKADTRSETRGVEGANGPEWPGRVQPVSKAELGQNLSKKGPQEQQKQVTVTKGDSHRAVQKQVTVTQGDSHHADPRAETRKEVDNTKGDSHRSEVRQDLGAKENVRVNKTSTQKNEQTIRKAIENLKGKFTIMADMTNVAAFSGKQLEEFEVMAHLLPNVKFVFYGDAGQVSSAGDVKKRLEQLQRELGADRIMITKDGSENIALNKGEKVIHISKGARVSFSGTRKNVYRGRYLSEEVGIVAAMLLYADQHEKPSEKGTMDLSMVRAELRMAIQEFQNSIVFARAA